MKQTALLTLALGLGCAGLAGPAAAVDQIGSYNDWSAYTDGKGKAQTCWMYSEPTKDEGNYSKRGRIYVLVTHRPGEGTTDQVQFTAGYPFKEGSAVQVAIDGKTFELFTNDDSAWARDSEGDKALVAAMRAGHTMTVVGTSSRGTRTKDTYSLSGATAAHEAISKACKVK